MTFVPFIAGFPGSMHRFASIFLILSFVYLSCNQASLSNVPVEAPANILKDQKSFLEYYHKHVKLSNDFMAFDQSLKRISKMDFLELLSSGDYFPLRLSSNDRLRYKLYEINVNTDDYIPIFIQSDAGNEYMHVKMEGKPWPGFDFVDINGNRYDSATTKGKIVVMKFWFIHCQVCVEEMPALNKFVQQCANRKDIVFLSLAFDQPKELKKFLAKQSFTYPVVADQKKYLIDDLNIVRYPTHVIISKEGIVIKVLNDYLDMESVLKKQLLQ